MINSGFSFYWTQKWWSARVRVLTHIVYRLTFHCCGESIYLTGSVMGGLRWSHRLPRQFCDVRSFLRHIRANFSLLQEATYFPCGYFTRICVGIIHICLSHGETQLVKVLLFSHRSSCSFLVGSSMMLPWPTGIQFIGVDPDQYKLLHYNTGLFWEVKEATLTFHQYTLFYYKWNFFCPYLLV